MLFRRVVILATLWILVGFTHPRTARPDQAFQAVSVRKVVSPQRCGEWDNIGTEEGKYLRHWYHQKIYEIAASSMTREQAEHRAKIMCRSLGSLITAIFQWSYQENFIGARKIFLSHGWNVPKFSDGPTKISRDVTAILDGENWD